MYQMYYSENGYFRLNYTAKPVYDPRAQEYAILDGKLTQKLNTAGTLTFTLPPGKEDPLSHKSVVLLDRESTLFSGRILKTETDFEGFTTVTCEGVLGELNGFVVRPYDFSGDNAQADDSTVNYLNALLDASRANRTGGWKVGNCSPSLQKLSYSGRSSTLYPTLLEELQQKLIQKEGGYLRASVGSISDNSPDRYLDYVTEEDYGKLVDQPIELGKNLTNLEITVDSSDRINTLVPLGKIEEDGQRLTVRDAVVDGKAYGKDYLEKEGSVAKYYTISATHQWEDVTDPTNLYNKAVKYLESVSQSAVSISASAADLSLAGYDVSPIRLGDRVRLISKIHNLDVTMLCTKRVYDLLDPANDVIQLESQLSSQNLTDLFAATGR